MFEYATQYNLFKEEVLRMSRNKKRTVVIQTQGRGRTTKHDKKEISQGIKSEVEKLSKNYLDQEIERTEWGRVGNVSRGKKPLFNCTFQIWGLKSELKNYLEALLEYLSNQIEKMASCWVPGSKNDLEIYKFPQE